MSPDIVVHCFVSPSSVNPFVVVPCVVTSGFVNPDVNVPSAFIPRAIALVSRTVALVSHAIAPSSVHCAVPFVHCVAILSSLVLSFLVLLPPAVFQVMINRAAVSCFAIADVVSPHVVTYAVNSCYVIPCAVLFVPCTVVPCVVSLALVPRWRRSPVVIVFAVVIAFVGLSTMHAPRRSFGVDGG